MPSAIGQLNPSGSGERAPCRPWGVGGSDIGAILGLSPYKGPLDVWLDKVGRLDAGRQPLTLGPVGHQVSGFPVPPNAPGHRDVDEAMHLRFGRHLEPFVAQEYERLTGFVTHEHPKTNRHPVHPHLFAHVDRLVSRDGGPVVDAAGAICATTLLECKTASVFNVDMWGEAWTDRVPPAYLAQCVWYTTITRCKEAHLAVLLGNSDFRVYVIRHDEELGQAMVDAALSFWDDHVMSGRPPNPRTRADVASLYPREVPGLQVEADENTLGQIRRLARISRLAKRLEDRSEQIKFEIAAGMKDAEQITRQGKTLATWRCSAPAQRLDVARLRREAPDVAGRFMAESKPTRRLVIAGATNV